MDLHINVIIRHLLATSDSVLNKSNLEEMLPPSILEVINKFITTNTINKFYLYDCLNNKFPNFVLIIPSRNNEKWVSKNLMSVFQQTYLNYRVIYIDDKSNDRTTMIVKHIVNKFNMNHRFKLIEQPSRNRQTCARFIAYHQCDDDEILCMLDGDDWLYDNNCLNYLAKTYLNGAMVTYGSYKRFQNGRLEKYNYMSNEKFPIQILNTKNFRYYRWISQHLRTGYAGLFKRIKYMDLVDENNEFYKVCTDLAEMMPVLEMASPNIHLIKQPTYVYNIDASNCHETSYFRKDEFPIKKNYREHVSHLIQTTPIYQSISLAKLLSERQLSATYSKKVNSNMDYYLTGDFNKYQDIIPLLVKILDICQLPFLGIDLPINNINNIFIKGIYTGYLYTNKISPNYIISNNFNIDDVIGRVVLSINNLDTNLLQEYFR